MTSNSSSGTGSANMALYGCYRSSSLLTAVLGEKTMHRSVPVTGGGGIARVTAVAISGEMLRGGPDAKAHPRVFSMMLFDTPKSMVECCGAGVHVSDDGKVATFQVIRRNKEDIQRNKDTGGKQRVGRESAGQLEIELGSVFTCVYMGYGDLIVTFGRIYELRIREITVADFGGRESYEFQLSSFVAYGGGNEAPHFNALPGERVPMLLTAMAEAVHHSPRLSPLVLAEGARRGGEKESVPTSMLDPRCRAMCNHEWTLPLMVLPEEAFHRMRRGADTVITSPPIIGLESPKWPVRERDAKTNEVKTRNMIEYGLEMNQFLPRVIIPKAEPLQYALKENSLNEFFVHVPQVNASVSLWEEAMMGFYILDTRHWYNGTLAAFVMGCPAIVHCYLSRKDVLSAWPDQKDSITLSFTACSAKKALMAKGAPPPVCTIDDNLGVFAVIGVGVLNAGYRVTHNSVISTLKILSEKREGGARRYNPNMQVTASTRKRIDGRDLPGNPLERYAISEGYANVVNVLESNMDWQPAHLASEYEFYVIPNTGPKTSRYEPNASTGETMFIASEALAWYIQLVHESGEAAAAQCMGTVMEQFANKIRNPPNAKCFHFPEDSAAQHDFLLFAVSKVWREAAGLDPLRNDNHQVLMARCYHELYPKMAQAPDSYIAELLQRYPPRMAQTTLDSTGPNSLTTVAVDAAITDDAMADAAHGVLTSSALLASATRAAVTSSSSDSGKRALDSDINTPASPVADEKRVRRDENAPDAWFV